MRAATQNTIATRAIADRLIGRFLARHGLPSPFPTQPIMQIDAFFTQAVVETPQSKLEDLGENIVAWRVSDFFGSLRYTHSCALHEEILAALSHPGMTFLFRLLGVGNVEFIREQILAQARRAEVRGLVKGGGK